MYKFKNCAVCDGIFKPSSFTNNGNNKILDGEICYTCSTSLFSANQSSYENRLRLSASEIKNVIESAPVKIKHNYDSGPKGPGVNPINLIIFSCIVALLSWLFFFKFLGANNNKTDIGFEYGDKVETIQQCLSAVSENSFSEMNKVSSRKDESSLKDLINSGQVKVLPIGTTGKITEMGFGKLKIRTDHGDVWISSQFVK